MKSLDHLFEATTPDVIWTDASHHAGVFLDVFPANPYHLMVMIRTPRAVREQTRLPWHRLPRAIRHAAHDLVDLTMCHMDETVLKEGEVVTRVQSGKRVLEPHMLLVTGADPSRLWSSERFENPSTDEQLRKAAAGIAFGAISFEADSLFARVDFSILD